MDILDVCDPTPDGYRYILVIADYFSKWTEAFPIKNKCSRCIGGQASGGVRCPHVRCGSCLNSTGRTIWNVFTTLLKAGATPSTTVCANSASSGLGGGPSLTSERRPARPCGWIWNWLGELNNSYVLTTSPAFGTLCKFFHMVVRDIQFAYNVFPGASVAPAAHPSICDLMRQDIAESPQGAMQSYYVDPAVDIPVVESLSPLIVSSTTPSPVVDAPVRSLTPNNRSLCYMQSGPVD